MLGEAGRGGAASGQPSGGDGVPAHQENNLIIADLVILSFYCTVFGCLLGCVGGCEGAR